MKAMSVKRLAILIAVLSLLGGAGFIVHKKQVERLGRNEIKKAKSACENGDFANAEMQFRNYLQVFPTELEIQIEHADTIQKLSKSPIAQNNALQAYNNVLRQAPSRLDVRRKLMQLKFDMGHLISSTYQVNGADFDLKILLEASSPNRKDLLSSPEGDLQFLLGRCYEERKEDPTALAYAVSMYLRAMENLRAIKNKASQRIEAGERCATLLRDKLQQPEKAEQVISSLVDDKSAEAYRGYLARGRYRLAIAGRDRSPKSLTLEAENDFKKARKEAESDFKKARKLAPEEPEVYLQLAKAAMDESKSAYNEARRILEDGLKHASFSSAIYETLAIIEIREGKKDAIDKAIEVLERGTKAQQKAQQGDLQLMPSVKEVSGIPTAGKNLTIVAVVDQSLYFRMFDSDGTMVVNRDEKKLTKQARKIEDLKKKLESLWLPHELSRSEKDEVIANVAAIVGQDRSQPDQGNLRLFLAHLLAKRGDTGKLLLQIEELKKRSYSRMLTDYLNAYYYFNMRQFSDACQLLVKLQTAISRVSDAKFKSSINVLLSQCYGELGEPEMQQNANVQALSANPQDLTAKLGWIANMRNQGDITGAIKEYRALVKQESVENSSKNMVRAILARLLIEQNQRRPESQREWNEVEQLINQATTEAAPESVEPVILRAELFFAQGKRAAAHEKLQDAQRRFPRSIEVRIEQAKLTGAEERVDDAFKVLDQAQQELGDQVDLRLERAKLWTLKKGPQVLTSLMDLSKNAEKFSKPDRKKLLDGLAVELERQQNLEEASILWTRLAEEDKTNLVLRSKLVELALQNANKDEIEKNIKQIETIEGNEGLLGRYFQARYLIWQAERVRDKDKREAIHSKARAMLDDLASRRGDWSLIPLASAKLAQQELKLAQQELELAQGSFTEDQIQAKEERMLGFLLQAINLGQRHAAVVRPAVQLLFKHGRVNDALELLSRIPVESQLAGDIGHQAVRLALEKRDFQRAEQIARTTVAAKPDDFQERIWLVNILLAGERRAEAAKELRDAVDRSPSDPDRWVTFVAIMIRTKQPAEAERIIHEAETKLPPLQAPKALATCCQMMGEMYASSRNGTEMKKWNDAARNWYKQAEAAQPEDLSIKRRLTEFFLRSKQINEAHNYLEAIRKQIGGAKSAKTAAWANRNLALVLASGTDRTQLSKALTLFEPDGQPVPAGQEGKKLRGGPDDLDDLRVLVQVLVQLLDMQKTVVHGKRAIEILESLTDQNLATSEDRFILARLYEVIGDWPRARQKYVELNLRTRNLRDLETLNRRPIYLAQFAQSLLQHHKAGEEQDLTVAQELVDEIKQLQPNELGTLILQVEIHQIRKEIDKATDLIQMFANRPNATPHALGAMAELAERIERFELAETLYGRASRPGDTRGNIRLAEFLGRRNRIKDALDICEPLWTTIREVELLGATCINILFGSSDHPRTPEPVQLNRVVDWFNRAIAQTPKQQRPNTWLFIGLGNLREKQGHTSEAQELYLRAANVDPTGISYNNLAWLAGMKDRKFKEALNYANRAIALKPDQPDFLDTRGMIYLAAGERQLALDDLQKAVAYEPLSPSKHYHLAQALLDNNDKEKARRSLETAKAKGFTPNGLDALEKTSYPNFLKRLESP
jgi:cellulose synthase operon protein C